MNTPPSTRRWPERLLRHVVAGGAKRRTLAGFAVLPVGDFFVPALPTQTAVIALTLIQPRRAPWIVLGFASAAAVGVALMAALVGLVDGYAERTAAEFAPQAWAQAAELLRRYGLWIVLAASIFPTPPRLLVAASLLAGNAASAVALAVFAGKLAWFGLVVTLLATVPARLHCVPWLGARIRALEALRRELQSGTPP